MLDLLTTAEIQALRLELHLFADRQTDPTVRSQCLTIDSKLAEALERDDPLLREVLANSVEQLKEALRGARRAIEPSNPLSLTPSTGEYASARFVNPIILSFHN
jgi:hypothetical protein